MTIDEVNKITDMLEHKASEDCDKGILKATAYRDGYVQACEDFRREIIGNICIEQG